MLILKSNQIYQYLGKEYGKLIPKIKEEIAKKNQMDLANTVKNGGVEYIEIDDTQIGLNSENLLVNNARKRWICI